MMNPRTDKLVRRTTMVATAVASYFLLTADYGPEPNALDPIKNAILSAERSAKEFIFGPEKESQEGDGKLGSSNPKYQALQLINLKKKLKESTKSLLTLELNLKKSPKRVTGSWSRAPTISSKQIRVVMVLLILDTGFFLSSGINMN